MKNVVSFDERLDEFLTICNPEKYNSYGSCKFKDGLSANTWFRTQLNKIMNSDDERCKIAFKGYLDFKTELKYQRDRLNTVSFTKTCKDREFLIEFDAQQGLDKFKKDSDVNFKNGTHMPTWFYENYRRIVSVPYKECKSILLQYEKFKRIEKQKQKLYEAKTRLEFLAEKNIDKFDPTCNIYFEDGKNMGKWFVDTKSKILTSTAKVDLDIKDQFEKFITYDLLRYEFFCVEDINKFNEDSSYRFSTKAIMYFWWEANKERILSTKTKANNSIKKQYEKYEASKNINVKKIRTLEK